MLNHRSSKPARFPFKWSPTIALLPRRMSAAPPPTTHTSGLLQLRASRAPCTRPLTNSLLPLYLFHRPTQDRKNVNRFLFCPLTLQETRLPGLDDRSCFCVFLSCLRCFFLVISIAVLFFAYRYEHFTLLCLFPYVFFLGTINFYPRLFIFSP